MVGQLRSLLKSDLEEWTFVCIKGLIRLTIFGKVMLGGLGGLIKGLVVGCGGWCMITGLCAKVSVHKKFSK